MKTILVTGANKGLGLEIVRQLAKDHRVILTARDDEKGEAAVDLLIEEGLRVDYCTLDVDSVDSITACELWISENYDCVDVIINNAGILLDWEAGILSVSDDVLEKTLATNTLGPLRVVRVFESLLKKSSDPRVINMSSGLGSLHDDRAACPAYSVSKAALNMVTRKLHFELDWLAVNSMCPGWTRTDMGGEDATRSVEEGVETAIWLATVEKSPRGKFLRDKKEIEW